jgi:hypothetical protein
MLIDRSMPAKISKRVYHIRSDISASAGTNLEIRWKAVTGASYAASQGNPITDNSDAGGRGDGTVPFWAARLASTPQTNVFDVIGVKHGGAAEHPTILDILWKLMQNAPVAAGPHVVAKDFAYASPARVAAIGKNLRAAQNPQQSLDNLSAGDYRAFVDNLNLAQ